MRKTVFWGVLLIAGIRLLAAQAGSRANFESVYFETMNARIDGLIRRFSGLPQKPILFSGNLIFAHGNAIRSVPLQALLQYADALKEAGCRRIDFNPGVTSLSKPEIAAKYDALVRHIRQLSLQLAINPVYLKGEVPVGSFQDFQAVALKAYAALARYKPDTLVVVHEPTTMAARMGIQTTPADWRQFIVAAARTVKQVSPSTRVGAGAFFSEFQFYQEFAKIPELDFLTVDIYSADPKRFETHDQMVELAHAAHKGIYIEETWRPHYLPNRLPPDWQSESLEQFSTKGVGNAEFEPLDIKWLQALSLYAATHGMEAVTAFQTTCFFAYVTAGADQGNSYAYNREVLKAIEEGRRTKTFSAFQEYSRKLGVN